MHTILQRISRHLEQTGMPETLFGRRAAGDPRLVGDLRNGRQPRPPLVARIEAYIDRLERGE
ncbi:hypothetical protein QLH51_10335 [Sphingomonas sp. 2R-10]|uniref:hypothetical protein n=1 Tax=Sphingomonas sp. 2R-10 TaxID=3045148 RepID=UPI000F791364|nr:hypothetical protein [Sphingomonas sp. 2R-10]MDJ0277191.1 hypothetical protein [Sphingomonas sp. 2R-10]